MKSTVYKNSQILQKIKFEELKIKDKYENFQKNKRKQQTKDRRCSTNQSTQVLNSISYLSNKNYHRTDDTKGNMDSIITGHSNISNDRELPSKLKGQDIFTNPYQVSPGRSISSKAEFKRNSNLTTMSQKPSQKNLSPTRGLNFINPQIHGSHVLELMPTS